MGFFDQVAVPGWPQIVCLAISEVRSPSEVGSPEPIEANDKASVKEVCDPAFLL